MNTITLENDGALVCDRQVVETGALGLLGCPVRLADNYAVRSYFHLFERYPSFQQLNAFLPSFINRYRSCPAAGCRRDDFDVLEFGKTVEMVGFPGKPRLEIYTSLHAMRDRQPVSVDQLSLETVLDMPLCLGNLKHIVFGDKVDIFEFETGFGLFEFVDGVAWELSFHDKPAECALRR